MEEIWKDIEGYEGYYQISNLGNVKSLERTIKNSGTYSGYYKVKERILKIEENKHRYGYYEISLKKNGKEKRFKVHRLVAHAFINNPDNKPEVNHIDGNKSNNCVSNLEWATSKENKEHAWNTGLINSNHKKRPIKCNENNQCFESVVQASIELNCNRRNIFRVLKGELLSTKNMTFSYITQEEYDAFKKELEKYRRGINNE